MKITIAADHAGIKFKADVIKHLKKKKNTVKDLGPFNEDSVDYPDYAKAVAKAVASKKSKYGILICGSGIGMSMAANKVKGIRAALVYDIYSAQMSRLHNDANIICIGSRTMTAKNAVKLIDKWLATAFEGGRHLKRVKKIG